MSIPGRPAGPPPGKVDLHMYVCRTSPGPLARELPRGPGPTYRYKYTGWQLRGFKLIAHVYTYVYVYVYIHAYVFFLNQEHSLHEFMIDACSN